MEWKSNTEKIFKNFYVLLLLLLKRECEEKTTPKKTEENDKSSNTNNNNSRKSYRMKNNGKRENSFSIGKDLLKGNILAIIFNTFCVYVVFHFHSPDDLEGEVKTMKTINSVTMKQFTLLHQNHNDTTLSSRCRPSSSFSIFFFSSCCSSSKIDGDE